MPSVSSPQPLDNKAKQQEIPAQMSELNDTIGILVSCLDELEDRLSSVLAPTPEGSGSLEKGQDVRTNLGQMISAEQHRLIFAYDKLKTLMERLEL